MPFERRRETFSVSFYQQRPGKPAPNDDLDLQLVWLKALEERGFNINPMVLAEYWLDYIVADWNEYGVARDNIKLGIPPPFSGKFRNGWQNSNGGWVRSEIWASLFPGRPDLAAKYGLMDACVDHGDGEGTYAEAFTASLESAAFFESDPKELLQLALSYVPEKSEIRGAVNTAISSYEKGITWKEAREAVVKATRRTGWFNAPNNLSFVAIGLLYGEGDFGKAICTAVNCGDDTDCAGATVGATMGIVTSSRAEARELPALLSLVFVGKAGTRFLIQRRAAGNGLTLTGPLPRRGPLGRREFGNAHPYYYSRGLKKLFYWGKSAYLLPSLKVGVLFPPKPLTL